MMRPSVRAGLPALSKHLKTIRESIGTPFFAYDFATITEAMAWLKNSAAEQDLLPQSRFCLAVFALPNLRLLTELVSHDNHFGLNCNAPEEILALREIGWGEWSRVVFSGGVLPANDLLAVASTGCIVNVASRGNLEILLSSPLRPRIGLRVDLTGIALKGIRLSELEDCLSIARARGTPIHALHAYPGTEIEDLGLLIRHAEVLINIAAKHPEIEEINFGGGFWFNYSSATGDVRTMTDLSTYFEAVRAARDREFRGRYIRLAWEPGRAVFAASGFFVTEVLESRENSPNTADVYVDASFTNVPVLKIRNRQHQTTALRAGGEVIPGVRYESRICGCTTLSSDLLLPRPCPLPELTPGDCVVIFDVGAYGRAGSYNYLSKRNPPEILLRSDDWYVIRRRQRPDHLLEGLEGHD
jgi:diaminopimelate decarboxylase